MHLQQAKPNRWVISDSLSPSSPFVFSGPYQTRYICSHSSKLSRSLILHLYPDWSGLRPSISSRCAPKESLLFFSNLLVPARNEPQWDGGSSSLKPIRGCTTSTKIDSQNYLWCIHNTYITWDHRSNKSQKATLLSSLLNCTESSMNIIISCSREPLLMSSLLPPLRGVKPRFKLGPATQPADELLSTWATPHPVWAPTVNLNEVGASTFWATPRPQ